MTQREKEQIVKQDAARVGLKFTIRKNEYGEYRVRLVNFDGKVRMDYFTNDHADALLTASREVKHLEESAIAAQSVNAWSGVHQARAFEVTFSVKVVVPKTFIDKTRRALEDAVSEVIDDVEASLDEVTAESYITQVEHSVALVGHKKTSIDLALPPVDNTGR